MAAISCSLFGQNYVATHATSEELKKEVLELSKEVFFPDFQLEYAINSCDLLNSLDSISPIADYTPEYLKEQQDKLLKDPYNSVVWNNIGNYYNSKNEGEEAHSRFLKAFQYLDSTFSDKSAMYYSFRGTIKLNLGMSDVMPDFEQALAINPNDSIAIAFLPMALMGSGQFDQVKTYCEEKMSKSSGTGQAVWFIYFYMADLMGQFRQMDPDTPNEVLGKMEYDELFDLSRINKLGAKYRNNPKIALARPMAEILPLLLKAMTFLDPDKPFHPVFTQRETQELAKLTKLFTGMEGKRKVNEFSRIKTLAFIAFLQGDFELAKKQFGQAIAVFPLDKQSSEFNTYLCYQALMVINALQENNAENIVLLEKVVDIYRDKHLQPKTLTNLSKCYLKQNDFEHFKVNSVWSEQLFPTDFETLRLATHRAFIDTDKNINSYLDKTLAAGTDNTQYKSFALQYALYCIYSEMANDAHKYIQRVRDLDPQMPCELCDRLEKEYLRVK